MLFVVGAAWVCRGPVTALNRDVGDTTTNADNGQTYFSDNDLYRELLLGFSWAFVGVCVVLSCIALFARLQ